VSKKAHLSTKKVLSKRGEKGKLTKDSYNEKRGGVKKGNKRTVTGVSVNQTS